MSPTGLHGPITALELAAMIPKEGISISAVSQLSSAFPGRIGDAPDQTPKKGAKSFIGLVKEICDFDKVTRFLKLKEEWRSKLDAA